jgi:transcriptional regulator with XRE-family HTH domain
MAHFPALVISEELPLRKRIRLARMASQRDPEAVAAALGISKRSYERGEAGERRFTRAELLVLAQVTGQDPSLFGVTSEVGAGSAMLSDLQARVNSGNDE